MVSYRRTPLAGRSLAARGDLLEQRACPWLWKHFPCYEKLWVSLIWDVTDRDFTPSEGQPRNACREDLRMFSQAHYTFLRSLMYVQTSIALESMPQIKASGPTTELLNAFNAFALHYTQERLLNIYAHFGRIRDMLFLMLDSFAQSLDPNVRLRKEKSPDFDESAVWAYVSKNISSSTRDAFCSWSAEVGAYRNLLHKVAAAEIIQVNVGSGETKRLILRHDKVKKYQDWTAVLDVARLDTSQFEDEMEVLTRNLSQLLSFAKTMWEFFQTNVDNWSGDEKAFRAMLSLPEKDS